jgi:hypothetical protein
MDAIDATNVAEAALKSISSDMPQIYVHLRGESSKIQKKGIVKRARMSSD